MRRGHELLEIGIAVCGCLVVVHADHKQSLSLGDCGCHVSFLLSFCFDFVTSAAATLENVVNCHYLELKSILIFHEYCPDIGVSAMEWPKKVFGPISELGFG